MRAGQLAAGRGFALPLTLFALVVIGLLVSGGFYAAREERRNGDDAQHHVRAFHAAEAGLESVMGGWNPVAYNRVSPAMDLVLPSAALGGGSFYTPTLTRMNAYLFLVRSEGEYRGPSGAVLARRLLASLVRLDAPSIDPRAALATLGSVTLSGTAALSGTDTVPNGWATACNLPAGATVAGPPLAGVRLADSTALHAAGGCAGGSCLSGSPPVQQDSALTAASFLQFGDLTFADLASSADKVVGGALGGIAPTVSGSPAVCRTADLFNWGEPYALMPPSPCATYLPIIYAPADLILSGGRGQGVLLVRGDLELSGGFEFFGPVVVLGAVRSISAGARIVGGLLVGSTPVIATEIDGSTALTYSSCAISRAVLGAARAAPVTERSWMQLY